METLAPGNVAPEQPSPSGPTFPYVIDCSDAILAQLAASALDGLCRLRHGGLEVGGVLYGRKEPGRITIEAVRELDCEHALGPAFRLSGADWDRLRAMIPAPASDPGLEGLETVGWYVSHTRCGLELTAQDVELFSRCFTDASHFALVLNPSQARPARAGYFARGTDGTLAANTPLVEFWIEHKGQDAADNPAGEVLIAIEPERPAAELETQIAGPPVAKPRRRIGKLEVLLIPAIGLGIGAAVAWIYMGRSPAARELRNTVDTPPPIQIEAPVDTGSASLKPATPVEQPPAPAQDFAVNSSDRSKPGATPVQPGRDSQQDRVKQLEQELARLRARLNQPGPGPSAPGPAAAHTEPASHTDISIAPPDHVDPGVVSDMAARLSIQPQVAAPPAAPPPTNPTVAPSRPATAAQPRAGRIIWTGLLHKGSVLFVEDKRCSSGAFTGALPGIPVRVHASPAELTDSGMIVYSGDSKQSRSESPGAQNGWNYTVYAYDPRRAGELRVLETPAAQNGWKKVVIRTEARSTSIIVIDWESISGR